MQPIFVGRQPIFDARERIVGFELLFRTGQHRHADIQDGDTATSDLLRSAFVDIGLEHLVGDHLAFVNLTRSFLEHEVLEHLPPDQVVLELLEDIEINAEVVAAVRKLKERGFRIALDDYQFNESHSPLVELADLVKLDVLALGTAGLGAEIAHLRRFDVELLAEKVETAESYSQCRELGFRYYQGFHLSHPHVIEGQRLETLEVALLRLTEALQDPDPQPDKLDRLISADPGLSVQLLRLANCPIYRSAEPIESLHQAILRLGQARIKRLALLLVLHGAGGDSQGVEQVMIRARMALLVARAQNLPGPVQDRYFTLGMLSGLERALGVPLKRMLGELHLSHEMEDALLHGTGPLAPVLELVAAFEQPEVPLPRDRSPIPTPDAGKLYLEAVGWAEEVLIQLRGD
ncbi:MAG: EAL and HDOD domain-containing protein [Pseudomonadota bacterium]